MFQIHGCHPAVKYGIFVGSRVNEDVGTVSTSSNKLTLCDQLWTCMVWLLIAPYPKLTSDCTTKSFDFAHHIQVGLVIFLVHWCNGIDPTPLGCHPKMHFVMAAALCTSYHRLIARFISCSIQEHSHTRTYTLCQGARWDEHLIPLSCPIFKNF